MTEITDEMIRVINGDYLVKGISAREAVRRILVLAEKQIDSSKIKQGLNLMTNRPEQPPQHLKVGDMYANDVEIVFNGICYENMVWIEVDGPRGLGWRYYKNEDGRYAMEPDGETLSVEVVKGDFKIVWRDDK